MDSAENNYLVSGKCFYTSTALDVSVLDGHLENNYRST